MTVISYFVLQQVLVMYVRLPVLAKSQELLTKN